jgi:hypothetical protein
VSNRLKNYSLSFLIDSILEEFFMAAAATPVAATSLAVQSGVPQDSSTSCTDWFNPCKLSELWGRITENWRTLVMVVGAAIAVAAAIAVFFVGISFWWAIVFLVIAAIALFGAYYMHQIPTFLEQRRQLGIMTENNKAMAESINRVEDHAKVLQAENTRVAKTADGLRTTLTEQSAARARENAAFKRRLAEQAELQKALASENGALRATSGQLADTNRALTSQVGMLTTAAEPISKFAAQHAGQIEAHAGHNAGLSRAISTLGTVADLAKQHVADAPAVVDDLRRLVSEANASETLQQVRAAQAELTRTREQQAAENAAFAKRQAQADATFAQRQKEANAALAASAALLAARNAEAAAAEERVKAIHASLQTEAAAIKKERRRLTASTEVLAAAVELNRSSASAVNALLTPPALSDSPADPSPAPVRRLPDLTPKAQAKATGPGGARPPGEQQTSA